MATTFSTVPYFVSPVICRGRSFQRNRACQSRSSGRLVVLHLGRGHQRSQDDPRLAAVDDVVVVVAEAYIPPSVWSGEASGSVVLARKSAVRR